MLAPDQQEKHVNCRADSVNATPFYRLPHFDVQAIEIRWVALDLRLGRSDRVTWANTLQIGVQYGVRGLPLRSLSAQV